MNTELVSESTACQIAHIDGLFRPIAQHQRQPLKPTAEWRLQLSLALQSTLDPTALLRAFTSRLTEVMDAVGLCFNSTDCALSVEIGERSPYRLDHQLNSDPEHLGRLTLWFRCAPRQGEAELAAELFAHLTHPLRNTMLYRRALEASVVDPLTQVNNRTNFDTVLKREIRLASRHSTPLSLVMVDIDHFKHINDMFGHLTGDFVLKAIAQRITTCIRASDTVYRFGGEEFCVILSNTDATGGARLAERIRTSIEQFNLGIGPEAVSVTASLGVAGLIGNDSALALVDRADRALYRSKRIGRNLVTTATENPTLFDSAV